MSDPNLPEGVKQSDIDATVGETFDPELCEHWGIKCENCGESMEKYDKLLSENARLIEQNAELVRSVEHEKRRADQLTGRRIGELERKEARLRDALGAAISAIVGSGRKSSVGFYEIYTPQISTTTVENLKAALADAGKEGV